MPLPAQAVLTGFGLSSLGLFCHCDSRQDNESLLSRQSHELDGDAEDYVMMQVYGQGMTVSAVEAEALHNLLKVLFGTSYYLL